MSSTSIQPRQPLVCLAPFLAALLLAGALSAQPYQLQSIDIANTASGQEIQIRSTGPVDRVGVQLFQELGVVIQLPLHSPGPSVKDLEPRVGLVAAIEVGLEEDTDGMATRIVVRTREPVSQSVSSEGNLLRVRLAPAGTPLDPPASASAPARSSFAGDASVEIATLQGTLERSNQARAELASRIEALSAENESLRERAQALEARRLVLATDLDASRSQASELDSQLEQRNAELEARNAASTQRQVDLNATIDSLQAQRGADQQKIQELTIRVEAATLERRDLVRDLDSRDGQVAGSQARIAQLEDQVNGFQVALQEARSEAASLTGQLQEARSEADKQYARAKARTDAGDLESEVARLTARLQRAESQNERLSTQGEELQEALSEQARTREAELQSQIAELDRERGELRTLVDEVVIERNDARRRLEESEQREADQMVRNSQLASELAEAQTALAREREGDVDRKVAIAREVEYRVSELRREIEGKDRELEQSRQANADLLRQIENRDRELEQSRQANTNLQRGSEGLDSALARKDRELQQSRQANADLLRQIETKDRELAQSQQAKTDLQRGSEGLDSELARKDRELQQSRQANADLLRRNEELRSQLEAATGAASSSADAETQPVAERIGTSQTPEAAAQPEQEVATTQRVGERPERADAEPAGVADSTAAYEPESTLPVNPPRTSNESSRPAEREEYRESPTPLTGGTMGRVLRDARVRSGPSTDDLVVAAIPTNSRIEVLVQEGAWYRVLLDLEGWVYGPFVERLAGDEARIIGQLNLREGPSTDTGHLAILPPNSTAEILSDEGDWLRVRVPLMGYVYETLLSVE